MTQLHTLSDWHIYLCPQCNASDPPKDKFVVVLCKHNNSAWGFFINSEIPPFILRNPALAKAQLKISPSDYPFLKWDSYVGCNDLKTFFAWELKQRKTPLKPETIEAILAIVEQSETLDAEQKRIIRANRPADSA